MYICFNPEFFLLKQNKRSRSPSIINELAGINSAPTSKKPRSDTSSESELSKPEWDVSKTAYKMKYSCEQCNLQFRFPCDLKRHLVRAHKENMVKCEVCLLEFSSAHFFQLHEKKCGETQIRRSQLRQPSNKTLSPLESERGKIVVKKNKTGLGTENSQVLHSRILKRIAETRLRRGMQIIILNSWFYFHLYVYEL